MAVAGRNGKLGSESITARGGKVEYGPKSTYMTPKNNLRTSAGRAPQSTIRNQGLGGTRGR